jgi:two-component system CheB/CheR fusion protein
MEKPANSKDLVIRADILRLDQVLSNLINNALKFTEKGVIVMGYDTSDKNHIHFYIKDSGRGLEMTKQREIFESFGRTDEFESQEKSGIGLGLQLSKGLVTKMGGEIWVEPNRKRGSVFNFTIPKKTPKIKSKSVKLMQQKTDKDLFLSGKDMAI